MAGLHMAFSTKFEPRSTRPSSRNSRKPSCRLSTHAEVELARNARGLRGQPGEELIDLRLRTGQALAHNLAVPGITASDAVLDFVESGDTKQRLVDDGRTLLQLGLD